MQCIFLQLNLVFQYKMSPFFHNAVISSQIYYFSNFIYTVKEVFIDTNRRAINKVYMSLNFWVKSAV